MRALTLREGSAMSLKEFFGYLLVDERSRTLGLALVDAYAERARKASKTAA